VYNIFDTVIGISYIWCHNALQSLNNRWSRESGGLGVEKSLDLNTVLVVWTGSVYDKWNILMVICDTDIP